MKPVKKGRRWIFELPLIVWGLRTQPSKATGQTPFFLVYGSEAVLPTDIMWKSPRLEMYDKIEADGSRQLELDSAEEIRCNALLCSARYLQSLHPYHDRNIQERSFNMDRWYFTASKMNRDFISSTQGGKAPLLSPKLEDQDLID